MLSKSFRRFINQFSFASSKQARNPTYSKLNDNDLQYFKQIIGETSVITNPQQVKTYNTDFMKKYFGEGSLALMPQNTQQIQQILQYCNNKKIAVVPQSGNTGLVGGSVPVHDEVVLSLKKLNKIIKYDQTTNILTAESGCILETVNEYLKSFQVEIPWDLGAKGSCLIGGNVSTQAGGKYFIKYGPLRCNILGLEIVLANGQILDLQSEVRKDNTGTDLKQLFISSEGTLGVVTKINVACAPIEKQKALILLKCSSFNEVIEIYKHSKSQLGKNLSAIEWMDSWAYETVMTRVKNITNPFSNKNELEKDFYVLIEMAANHNIEQLVEQFYSTIDQTVQIKDSVKADNEKQYYNLWAIRELVNLACSRVGYPFKYDISLDMKYMNDLVIDVRQRSKQYAQTVGYGHIGDGNLHINVNCFDKNHSQIMEKILEPYVFEYLQKIKGSISAEHGLGLMKAQFLHLQKDKVVIDYMKKVKTLFDPNHILNPYKVYPYILQQ